MLTVCIARLKFFDFHGTMCGEGVGATLPGECYWYKKSLFAEIGIRIHLYGVLPAGILAVFQFIPAIRRKSITFHRVAGYISNVLVLIGTIGGFMIAGHSVGGGADIQVAVWFLGIVVIIQLGLAMWNIKKLQIDQHRAWMLRAWFLVCSILPTLRSPKLITTARNTHHNSHHPRLRRRHRHEAKQLPSNPPLRTHRVHATVRDQDARILPRVRSLLQRE